MRSNLALYGMCRDAAQKGLHEQAAGRQLERSRQTGFGAGAAPVTGLARVSALRSIEFGQVDAEQLHQRVRAVPGGPTVASSQALGRLWRNCP